MSRRCFSAKISATTSDGSGIRQVGSDQDPAGGVATAATVAALTDVDAATAVLVADAASPTQGHVNTLAAAVTVLDAAVAALVAGATSSTPSRSDCLLSFDTTAVGSKSVLREVIRRLTAAAEGSGGLTS